MSVSKKVRFEVFKRDSFTCQYCGRKSPDVVLHADHIHPVSKGGEDDPLNLITSCVDCNLGKSNRTLEDGAVLAKQHAQLAELQEKREQLEMMMDWQRGLLQLETDHLEALAEYWNGLTPGYVLNDYGKEDLRKLITTCPVDAICDAMRAAAAKHLATGSDGKIIRESIGEAWEFALKIAPIKRDEANSPWLKDAFYIRAIVRNRLSYYDPHETLALIKDALIQGHEVENLKQLAKDAYTWTEWRKWMEDLR